MVTMETPQTEFSRDETWPGCKDQSQNRVLAVTMEKQIPEFTQKGLGQQNLAGRYLVWWVSDGWGLSFSGYHEEELSQNETWS